MLRISIELVPFGNERHACNLATLEIINDGTGSVYIGNYDVRLLDKWNELIRSGRVEGYHRKVQPVHELVEQALGAIKNVPND